MWHFEVAMAAESFSKEFVGQNSRLGESIHAAYDCTVDKTGVDLFSQTILINKFLWEDFDWHAHVLMAFEWCSEVDVLASAHVYFAPLVLMTLFHMSLVVVRSAVCVVSSYG